MQEFVNRGTQDESDETAEGLAALEAALRVPKEGEVVTGQIVRMGDDTLMVDVGYKSEGLITLAELSHRPLKNTAESGLKVGDSIKVVVMNVESHGEGMLKLSVRKAEEAAAWVRVVEQFEAGEIIEAKVTEAVKGGLVVDLGLRAFLPASQVDRTYVNDLSKFVGETIRVKILEIDRTKNRAILTRKQVLDAERDSLKQGFWDNAEEGQVRAGTVKSLTDFGCFVDLGGVDGLLHISEMSYGRIKHPSQLLKEGDKIQVKILRLDREKEKVSLGMKQAVPDPWASVEERFPVGSVVTGTVARLATFGAFVELESGVDGLIHISQLADRRVGSPSEVVTVGETVTVKVVGVSMEQRRISLSIRELDSSDAAPAVEEPAPADDEQASAETPQAE